MAGPSLAIIVLLAVLVSRAYLRSRPPGYHTTMRDRVLVTLTVYGVVFLAVASAVLVQFRFAPEVTFLDRAFRGLTVAAIGAAAVAVFLLIDSALRILRRSRHSS